MSECPLTGMSSYWNLDGSANATTHDSTTGDSPNMSASVSWSPEARDIGTDEDLTMSDSTVTLNT